MFSGRTINWRPELNFTAFCGAGAEKKVAGEQYRCRQRATVMLIAVVLAMLGLAISFHLAGTPSLLLWPALALLLAVAFLFSTMTVSIANDTLHWHFGPGFWKKSLPLADIASAHTVRNKWWYGWGIRYTPHGWLYNVSGLAAVEIGLTNGKTLRIGTDEPDRLREAILAAQHMREVQRS